MRVRTLVALLVSAAIAPAGLSTPAFAADPAISGMVQTVSGAGVPGARIEASVSGGVVATATTDALGRYSLDVPAATYTLRVTPASSGLGAATAMWVEAPRDWPLDVVLTAPSPGRLFVTGDLALDSGEPLTGGSVLFAGSGVRTGADGFFSMAQPTGVSGTWSFSGTAAIGSGSLWMSASGGASSTLLQDVNAQLTVPVTTTTVAVRDAAGNAISGARVRLNSGGYGKSDSRVAISAGTTPFVSSWTASGVSDANGTVTLTRPTLLSAVSGTLMVDPPAGSRLVSLFTDAAIPPSSGSLTATLTQPTVTTSGRVTYTDGTGVPGVSVTPFDATSSVNAGNPADASGAYAVTKPLGFTGAWQLTARSQASLATRDSLWFTLRGGSPRTWSADRRVDFVLPRTTNDVRVVDGSGRPVAGAIVTASVNDGAPNPTAQVPVLTGEPVFTGTWSSWAVTDDGGRASLSGLVTVNDPMLSVAVRPAAGGTFTGTSREVLSSQLNGTVITLPLPPQVTASGTVGYSDGSAAPAAQVTPIDPTATVNGGNSADESGRYAVTKPSGFTGTWQVSARPQARLEVPDPLWFSLRGGAPRTWSGDMQVDFTVPKTLYRMRIVDTAGNPITHALVTVVVTDTARVAVLPGEPEFTGSWRGRDYTGTDGIAQVPGLVMTNPVTTTVTVAPDPTSRFLPRTVTLPSSNLSETVIALTPMQPSVTGVSPSITAPGDWVTITGQNLAGITAVTLGGTPLEFVVDSETRVRARITSNVTTGTLTLGSAAGPVTAVTITVTSRDLAVTTTALSGATVGSAFRAELLATGGLAPLRWTMTSGSLPTGVTLSSTGVVSGTPTRALSGSVGVTVTDARGASVSRVLPWTVAPKPATASGPISAITASPGASRISLGWKAPVDNGGNVITGYRVEQSVDGRAWTTVIADTGTTALGVSVAVSPQSPVRFRVAAINAAGVGSYGPSSVAGPVSAYGVAGPVRSLAAVRTSATTLQVTWTAPATTGGTPVTGYRIRTSPDGRTWTTLVASQPGLTARVTARAGTPTWVEVSAVNLAGFGTVSVVGPIS